MIYQSQEANISVLLNKEIMPAVIGADIEIERSVDGNTVNTDSGKYRVTLKRYLTVGMNTGNLFALKGFNLEVADGWNTYDFIECEWLKLERKLDNNGVYETMVVQAKLLQVI